MRKQALILWEKIRNEPLLAALSCTFVLLLVLFLFTVFLQDPKWIYRYLGLPKKPDALKFLGIGMGGVLLALQALMSYKRAKAMEDAANAQAGATKEQAKANQNTEQGQRQERLKNAIEHLGHTSDSVRLGGAYELFHLAEDTAEDTKDLRQTVLDILCAHIRRTTGEDEYRKKYKAKPSEEVQSLLTLLFVQEHDVFKGLHINLQESWLNGADLPKARLENAVLTGVHLKEARLWAARLQGAFANGAQLQEAILSSAAMQRTRLEAANLQDAGLMNALLHGSVLRSADLRGTKLIGGRMQGVDLWGAHLQGAELGVSRLQGTILREADLRGSDLRGAQLQGVFLLGARLQGAELALRGPDGFVIKGTDLRGASSQGPVPPFHLNKG